MPVDTVSKQRVFAQVLREQLPQFKNQSDDFFARKIGNQKFDDLSQELSDYIETSSDETLSMNERLALSNQAVKCLIRYLKQLNIPVTINTLVNDFGLLSHAVDQSFPGYAISKLLKCAIVPSVLIRQR